jgi:D-alanine-D-alanine ligase-like ATP-grasp enzyme
LELDFGAADVIYNAQQDRAYSLEVNSAPGIMGTTLVNYTNALRSL